MNSESKANGHPPAMDSRTEKILLEQIRNGDAAQFERLVSAYSGQVINLAYRLTGNREEAEDLAQEAFLRLHKSLSGFRGDSSLGTWLYRTVSRLAIDYLRREKLRRKIFFFRRDEEGADPMEMAADTAPSPRDRLLARETAGKIQRGLERLSPRQKAVFVLRHQEELPLKEIAGILGLEEGTIKVHLHRAVARLREELEAEEGTRP